MQLRIRPNAILEEEFQYGGRVFLPPELLPQPWIEVKNWEYKCKKMCFLIQDVRPVVECCI